jgi:hypothetical protein
MCETFENAGSIRVVHGLVDRIRNAVSGIGSKTMTLQEILGHIGQRERLKALQQQRAHDQAEREETLRTTLGTNIRTDLPELHDFLAHGWWNVGGERRRETFASMGSNEANGRDPESYARFGHFHGIWSDELETSYIMFANTLARDIAVLHDRNGIAFGRVGEILLQRCERILELYESNRITIAVAHDMLNSIAQSGAVDVNRIRQFGRELSKLAKQKGQREELSEHSLIAAVTSMHVPKWQHEATAAMNRK